MPTNLAIDDGLLAEALKLGGLKTKRETVNQALEDFIRSRKRRSALKHLGTIQFAPRWSYKADRQRR
ncbi:MAG: type II toxin-antitoxin system VapB family antitoxin [Thermoanaerobaculia bacterium]|nr:type II toxin-antitoxin system VapB family antitoxin [Thermoanaerobaculia bacterium]